MQPPRAASRGVGGRILRDSAGWFTEGATRRTEARRAQRCVECARSLPSRRTPYCSRMCRWKYHGRYFWDAARIYVLRRDRYTCQACGRRDRRRGLDVDHIREIARGGEPLSYENLQTLCRSCHRAKTVAFLRGRGRSSPDGGESLGPEWFPA